MANVYIRLLNELTLKSLILFILSLLSENALVESNISFSLSLLS